MEPIHQKAMRKAEKTGASITVHRNGIELCVVWDRQKQGLKQIAYQSRTVKVATAGAARRAEELLQLYDFNVASDPGAKLAAAVQFAEAEHAAAQIRGREVHRLRKRGSGKREPW